MGWRESVSMSYPPHMVAAVLRLPDASQRPDLCRELLVGRVRRSAYCVGDTPESCELPSGAAAAKPVISSRTMAS